MPFDRHANLAYSTVAVAPSPALSGTTLQVAAGQGALFPVAPFNATVWPTSVFPLKSNAEIIRVTSVVGDVLTIQRAQEGTSARAITVGDQIANTVTAKVIEDLEAAVTAGGLTAIEVSAGTLTAEQSGLTFGNSNGVSFGLNTDGVITGTVQTNYQSPGNYLTTAALSQDSSKYAGTLGAITGGSITVNTAGVSVNLPAYLTTAMQSNAVTLSNVKVSAGGSSAFRSDFTFSNASGVSFGLNAAGVITATVATNYQSAGAYLTTAALSQDSSRYAGTNGAITGGSITVNTAGVSVNLPAYLTTAMASNRGSDFVQANAAFAGTNANGTIASSGISVSVAAQTVQTQNLHNVTLSGNTAGVLAAISSGTMTIAGGNNITISQNGNAITISGANVGGAQTGISGLIASDATYTSGTVSFSGQNNITIGSSVNGGTQYIRLSVGNYLTTAMASDRGSDFVQAAAGFNGTNASGTIASNAISVSVAAPVPIATAVKAVGSVGSTGTITRYAPEDHQHAGVAGLGISTSGNTAGTTGSQVGTYWFEGGNSITVSQITSNNGSHTLRLSVGNYLTTAMASNRGSDFVQATAVFNGTNATGTIASGALSVSVAAPIPIATAVKAVGSVGSTGTITRYAPEDHQHAGVAGIGISTSGNTAGNTGSQVGTYWFEGGNSITVSQITSNNGSHTLRLSVGNYLTTAMASNRGSDFVQANAAFAGTGANGTIASNGISVSVNAQTNQTLGLYVSSNTYLTSSGIVDARSLTFRGDKSITVGISASEVLFSVGAYITTGMLSNASTQFVQANAVFNGTNATGTIASNAISVSVAAPIPIGTAVKAVASVGSTGTITRYAPEDHQHPGVAAFAVTNTGNTLGNTRSQVGTMFLAASGGITASQSTGAAGNDTVWLSVAAPVAQTNQTLGLYAVSNTTGQSSSSTFDARTLSFHGAGIASVGYSNGSVVVSVPSGGGGLTNIRVSAGTTSNLLSAVTFGDSNGISFGIDASTITASVNTVGTATTVTPVASANSVGTVTRWAAEDHRHAGIGAIGISTSGNTAGTTGSNVGTYWFQGGNNLTVSQITSNNGSHTIVFSAGAGGALSVSAGTLTGTRASLVFSDSNGVSFGMAGSTITASVNTVGTATTVYSVASANSVGTVTRWAAEDHRHAGIGGIGISTSGNTDGTTGSVLGTYWIEGGANVTVSQITSNNGSHTLRLSGAAHATLSAWPDVLPGSTAVSTYYSASTSQGAGAASTRTGYTFSLYAVPMPLPAHVAFSEIRVGVSNQSVVGTGSATHMFSLGFYSNNASTLSLVSGFYGGIVLSQNSQTAQTFSVFTATTAGATSGAGGGMAGISKHSIYSSQGNISANSQLYGRLQFIRLDSGAVATLSEGQYYVVLANATASSGANVLSNVGILQSNAIFSAHIPDIGRENNTQTSNYLPAWGAISTTFSSNSNAAQFFPLPVSIAISDMTLSQGSAQRFHFPVMRNHS